MQLISECIRGVTLEFYTHPSLFSASAVDEGTRLLLENIEVPNEGLALDVGCGYGVIGIFLAKYNPRLKVYMVDINPLAVKLARLNAKLNNVQDRVVVIKGDLYDPVRDMKFDTIVSNPPLASGMKVVLRIIREGYERLKDSGSLQLVLRKGDAKVVREALNTGFKIRKLIRKHGYTIVILGKY